MAAPAAAAAATVVLVQAPAVWLSACADIWLPLTFEVVALGTGGASFVSA